MVPYREIDKKNLHESLYMKKYKTLGPCIKDATDYDDNCDFFQNQNQEIDTNRIKSLFTNSMFVF